MTAMPRAKIRLPLLAIAAAAVGLIAARMIWPKLNFDTTSLILFGIAAVAWALAYVPVTRLKFGDFEAELGPMVAALEQKVIAAEAATTVRAAQETERRPDIVYRGDPLGERVDAAASAAIEEYRAIVQSGASDREKIVRVAALIDRVARERDIGPALQDAARSFLRVRDWVAYASAEPTPQITAEALDLAWRLMRLIAR